MATLTLELPDQLLLELHQSLPEVEGDVRLALAIEWYRRGIISQGRAAELAGIPRVDFLDELGARKIDVVELDMAEWQQEAGLA